MNYQQLMIRKPIRRWNCETLRDLTGWKWQKAEGWNWLVEEFERQAGLVAPQGRGKIFSDGTVQGGIWSNWSGILFFAFVGPLVDEFYNRSSHDQDQVIKATLTVNYKKLMNLGFGFIKPSPFEGKRMKRESKFKILFIPVYYRSKKWDPPNPSWILEGEQSVQTRYLGPRTQPSLRKPRGYQLEVRAKGLPQGCFVFDLQVGASTTWLAHVFFFHFFQSSPCNPFFPTFSRHNDTIMIAIPTHKF